MLGLLGSYWYATAHYIVTAITLVWLYRVGHHAYVPSRRALVAATLIGLGVYLTVPTAPPRFVSGYIDVLKLNAADGWWGGDASAPKGLGGLTNQLAAQRALESGMTFDHLLEIMAATRAATDKPIVLYCYYNLLFSFGVDEYCRKVKAAGAETLGR